MNAAEKIRTIINSQDEVSQVGKELFLKSLDFTIERIGEVGPTINTTWYQYISQATICNLSRFTKDIDMVAQLQEAYVISFHNVPGGVWEATMDGMKQK